MYKNNIIISVISAYTLLSYDNKIYGQTRLVKIIPKIVSIILFFY